MTDWSRVIPATVLGLALCTAVRANMVSVYPEAVAYQVSSGAPVTTDSRSPDASSLFGLPEFSDLDLLTVGLLPDPEGDVGQTSEARLLRILSDGQSSFSLCLYALLSLGVCRSAPLVKKLSVGPIPDWYCAGGPWQIGHSLVLAPDCCSAAVYCFIQPEHPRENSPSRYCRGAIMSLWRHSQFTPTALTSRGPPLPLSCK